MTTGASAGFFRLYIVVTLIKTIVGKGWGRKGRRQQGASPTDRTKQFGRADVWLGMESLQLKN